MQSPATFAKLPYDPYTDIVPITLITISPQAIVAHPSLPVKNIKELVALAQARPGELNMGTAGNVLPSHYFFMLAKVKMEIVPYKGAGPLMIDASGGHVPLAIGAVSSVQGAVRSGRVRMLGVTSPSRRVSRRAAHLEGRARLTTPTPGSACSRRAARRGRSSRGYATTSRRCCRSRT